MVEERKLNNISKIVTINKEIHNISYCNEFDGIRIEGKDMPMTKCEFIELYGGNNKGLCLEIAKEHCKSLRENLKRVTDPIAIAMFLNSEIDNFERALKVIGEEVIL